jgi:hypothetical protein
MAVTTHPDGSRTSPNWDADEGLSKEVLDRDPPRGMSRKEWEAKKRKAKAKTKSKSKGGIVFRGGGAVQRPKRTKLY